MVNVAPWQPLSGLVPMATAPVKVNVVLPPAGIALFDAGAWLVNVTAGVVQVPVAPDTVIVPLPVTAVSRTAYAFGLFTLMTTSPVPPGTSSPEVTATADVVGFCAVPACAVAVPVPLVTQYAAAVPAATATMAVATVPRTP